MLEAPGPDGAILDILRPRLGAVCPEDGPHLLWFDASTDLRGLSDAIRERADSASEMYLLSRDGNLSRLDEVNWLLQMLGL